MAKNACSKCEGKGQHRYNVISARPKEPNTIYHPCAWCDGTGEQPDKSFICAYCNFPYSSSSTPAAAWTGEPTSPVPVYACPQCLLLAPTKEPHAV